MVPVSIVIITKNEAALIAGCIEMARLITEDIIVIDNGSTDNTLEIVQQYNCRIYHENWVGYGANKNKGNALARYNWILSIDADEIPDLELINSIHQLDLKDPGIVYDIRFKSYFGKKQIRFGNWGRDHHLRLFNRSIVKWSDAKVHETLLLPKLTTIKRINGYLYHYTANSMEEYGNKAIHYARLSALQYHNQGKKHSFLKLYLSPGFSFFRTYIMRFGFLDGLEGLNIALIHSKNTWLKYHYLRLYQHQRNNSIPADKQGIRNNFNIEY